MDFRPIDLDTVGTAEALIGRKPPEEIRHFLPWGSVTPAGQEILAQATAAWSMDNRYRLARDWIAKHGWPTGARYVRGSHAGTYVYDVLGAERIPDGYGWPHRRPSFREIVRAFS